jgi:hypothetical protein
MREVVLCCVASTSYTQLPPLTTPTCCTLPLPSCNTADYPYTGKDGKCQEFKPVANISSHVRLPANNYTALMNAVANIGPIAISAAAEPWQMQAPRSVLAPHLAIPDNTLFRRVRLAPS